MDLHDMSRHAIKFYRTFLRILFTADYPSSLVILFGLSIVGIIAWMVATDIPALIFGIIFLFGFIYEILAFLYAPSEMFLGNIFLRGTRSLKFKESISSYLLRTLVIIFLVGSIGLYTFQLSIEVIYLIIGIMATVYAVIGYIFFIRNRQKLEQLLRNDV
jgi:TctA family transporter